MAIAEREVVGLTQEVEEDFKPQPYVWTREQFYEMGDTGLFEGRRAILIEGEILAMPAMKDPHRTSLTLTDQALRESFGDGFFLSVQCPFDIGKATDPEPDLAVIKGTIREYSGKGLTAAELIVEISDTTYAYDRREKASLYASAGIQDYWIVRLKTRQVEVYRQPKADETQPFRFGYSAKTVHSSGEIIQPLAAPNPVAVSALLP
ncbi:MAG: Uma2 family endonuclease [Janthinobacterium lividum]